MNPDDEFVDLVQEAKELFFNFCVSLGIIAFVVIVALGIVL
jgi:hypothetical protein